jgi:hypothetical protein
VITAASVQEAMTARAPTLGAGSRALVYANLALEAHTTSVLGTVANDMLACWALHRMMMDDREQAAGNAPLGPIQSQRTMDISVTYAAVSIPVGGESLDWNLTSFGRQYQSYLKSRAAGKPRIIRNGR